MLARIATYFLLVGVLTWEYLEKSPGLPLAVRPSHVAGAWVDRIRARMAATPLVTIIAHDDPTGPSILHIARWPTSTDPACARNPWRHDGPISLLSLCRGDWVELDYHSAGCVYNTRHRITLIPAGEGRVAARITGPAANPDPAFRRTRLLTRAQTAGLDNWLRIHRRQAGFGGCTSETELVMSLYVGGRLIARETHHDSRCQFEVAEGTLPVRFLAFVPAGEPLPGW